MRSTLSRNPLLRETLMHYTGRLNPTREYLGAHFPKSIENLNSELSKIAEWPKSDVRPPRFWVIPEELMEYNSMKEGRIKWRDYLPQSEA